MGLRLIHQNRLQGHIVLFLLLTCLVRELAHSISLGGGLVQPASAAGGLLHLISTGGRLVQPASADAGLWHPIPTAGGLGQPAFVAGGLLHPAPTGGGGGLGQPIPKSGRPMNTSGAVAAAVTAVLMFLHVLLMCMLLWLSL